MAYIDIETTWLSPRDSEITTIALYDGVRIRTYVQGVNLQDFPRDLGGYRLLVSFNGKAFDVPFIERYFGIRLEQAHIDLRHVLGSLGFKGGLKACEKQLGLDRGELEGVDGFFAVMLWQDYLRRGNKAALETLLAYNAEDVVNLEALMVRAYNLKAESLRVAFSSRLPTPVRPDFDFRADRHTIRYLKTGRMESAF